MVDTLKCPYCLEFVHKASKPILNTIGWPYKSRILYKTSYTVIIPTIGAIVPNYLLLIPLKHNLSIKFIEQSERTDLIECIEMLENRFNGGTFFEHGTHSVDKSGGASIEHVHLHYLPIDIDLRALTPELQYSKLDNINDIVNIDSEYLFIRSKQTNYITKITSLPSQFFRRIVAKLFGVEKQANWKEFPFTSNMIATYNSWL